MKKKTVIRVQMHDQKCRARAMEIAAKVTGVSSIAIEGKESDQVVVIGEGLDPIKLTVLMRKKVGHAELISVQDVKPRFENETKFDKKEQGLQKLDWPQYSQYQYPHYQYPYSFAYQTVCDPTPTYCSIM